MDVGFLYDFLLTVLMRDTSTYRLIAKSKVAVQSVRRSANPLCLESHRVVPNNGIFNVGDDLFPRHRFNVVGIDIANEPILQTSLDCVAPGMREYVPREATRLIAALPPFWRDSL